MADHAPPTCPYCQAPAEKVGGGVIYPHRKDLAHKFFWRCPGSCAAWVGSHPGTDRPLGRLANEELRNMKRAAHDAFDPIWRAVGNNKKAQRAAKSRAYEALARELGIPRDEAHIAMMDVELCRRTIAAAPKITAALARA